MPINQVSHILSVKPTSLILLQTKKTSILKLGPAATTHGHTPFICKKKDPISLTRTSWRQPTICVVLQSSSPSSSLTNTSILFQSFRHSIAVTMSVCAFQTDRQVLGMKKKVFQRPQNPNSAISYLGITQWSSSVWEFTHTVQRPFQLEDW